jgi:hypothetical protein
MDREVADLDRGSFYLYILLGAVRLRVFFSNDVHFWWLR